LISTIVEAGKLPKSMSDHSQSSQSFDDFVENEGSEVSNCTLHIADLTPTVKTEHLAAFLTPFTGDYTLRWLDDYNALAVFDSPERFEEALRTLPSTKMFTVKPYQLPPARPSWLKQREQLKPKPTPAPTPASPWKTVPKMPQYVPPKNDFSDPTPFSVLAKDDDAWGNDLAADEFPTWEDEVEEPEQQKQPQQAQQHEGSSGGDWASLLAGEEANKRASEDHGWGCPRCTFRNAATASACAMCGTSNPY
jgi:hypothetical protein